MKTNELRKWLIKSGFGFEEYETSIIINGLLTIYKESQALTIYDESWQKGIGLELLNKAIEYTKTPVSEREDEKKYRIITNYTFWKDSEYLTLILNQNKHYFSIFDTNSEIYQRIFTQSEIDNFPKEIKGAIECGFLRKVEVNE